MKRKPTVYRVNQVKQGFAIQRKRAWFGLIYGFWRTVPNTGPFGQSHPWPIKHQATIRLMHLLLTEVLV